MKFLLSNQSSHVSAIQCAAIAASCQAQLRQHVDPAWEFSTSSVGVLPSAALVRAAIFKRSVVIVIKDSLSVDGALGDHSVDDSGFPIAEIGVQETLADGGTILGPNGLGSVISHEILETRGDEFISTWDDAPDGTQWAHELCDAVEGDSYLCNGVWVSNFVKPAFFDQYAHGEVTGAKFDYLGKLSSPFSLAPGGYTVVKHQDGSIDQVFGAQVSEAKQEKIRKRRRVHLRSIAL
jgi:hypothetical protein